MDISTIGFILSGISGTAWTLVYIQLIRLGFQQKTYGMPFIALALNLAWEALYAGIGLMEAPTNIQTIVNVIWLGFDIAIVATYFKYGKEDFEKLANKKYFIPWSIIVLLMAFTLQVAFYQEFGKSDAKYVDDMLWFINPSLGCWYSAFTQNLIMSIAFISLLVQRKSLKGQHLSIAIAKCIGTLTPSILYGVILESNLVTCLGVFILIFDIIYIWMIIDFQQQNKITHSEFYGDATLSE
ncbi:hypothetical protein [Flammeovirga sp. SubArs3]|uniref:transmembrane-type terpene cyclase n=1 Tax=Flammeovirga sp. SubArs3 TaxID=2995316 RepID=UPI00248B25E3|nr:hypothetical protein [Flammeovirga sp. SubArs3]